MQDLFAKKRVPVTGPLAELGAGTKLLVTVVTAIVALCASGLAGQVILCVMTAVYAFMLRRPKLLLGLYLMMLVMSILALLFAMGVGAIMPAMGSNKTGGLIIPFLRGVSMMNVVLVLAMTTRVEDMLSTMEGWHLPFWLFFPISVMLLFIPTFFRDIQQIWETLKIRGWPMDFKMVTFHPILTTRLLMIPVLFRALKTSEVLGVAAELKGIGAGPKLNVPRQKTIFSRIDRWVWVGVVATVALVVVGEMGLGSYLPEASRSMS